MSKDQPVDELRAKFREIHNLFHGRYDTHTEVARHSHWTASELEGVQIQDEELMYNELEALIQAECNRARLSELKNLPIFYEYVESGDDKIDSQATIYIRQRIKELQQLRKEGE